MILEGIIQEDASVLGDNGKIYHLPVRGTDEKGYSEVLIDATKVGGEGSFSRQSVKPYVGMEVRFYSNCESCEGFNYQVIPLKK